MPFLTTQNNGYCLIGKRQKERLEIFHQIWFADGLYMTSFLHHV